MHFEWNAYIKKKTPLLPISMDKYQTNGFPRRPQRHRVLINIFNSIRFTVPRDVFFIFFYCARPINDVATTIVSYPLSGFTQSPNILSYNKVQPRTYPCKKINRSNRRSPAKPPCFQK